MRLDNGLTSLISNNETINLIKELLQYDKQRVNDSLRLMLGIMSRGSDGKREVIVGDGALSCSK